MTPNPNPADYPGEPQTEDELAQQMQAEERAIEIVFYVELLLRCLVAPLIIFPLIGIAWHKISRR